MKSNLIAKVENEDYLNTVARAISSPFTTPQFEDDPSTDYHRIDISELMLIAATEDTPIIARIAQIEAARAIKHFWLEQYLPGPGSSTVVALSETSDPSPDTAKVPTRYENVMMKQGKLFIMSDEAQIVARANGLIAVGPDEMGRQLSMLGQDLVRDMERAIIQADYDDGSTGNPRQFRGLLGDYLNGNLTGWIGGTIASATTLDKAAAQLTSANIAATLDAYLLQMHLLYAGPKPNTLYVPPQMAKMIVDAASTKIQIVMTQQDLANTANLNLGGAVGKFYTSFGIVNIVAHPLLVANTSSGAAGTSRILALHEPSIRAVDYVGYGGIHMEPRAKTGPTETRLMSRLWTLEVRNLKSHGCIKNFYI